MDNDKNWVGPRALCTIDSIFGELVEGIRADVDERNTQLARSKAPYHFVLEVSPGSCSVACEGRRMEPQNVTFTLQDGAIDVTNEVGAQLSRITVALDPVLLDCRCVLNGEADDLSAYRYQWQVRREMLEPLFFDERRPLR